MLRSHRLATLVCTSVAAVVLATFASPAVASSPAGASSPAVGSRRSAASGPTVYPAMAGVSPGAQIETLTGAQLAAALDGIVASGAKWVRIDLFWPVIERSPGAFGWSEPDPVIRGALARGLQVLAVPDYKPSWTTPAKVPAAYAAFVSAAASRYAPLGVRAWEIWNEPNLAGNWGPVVSPTAYTATLNAAYQAIKAVDSGAEVVAGALSPATDAPNGSQLSPATFLQRMYAAGAARHFDALSVHPSSYPDMPMSPDSWNTFYELPHLHSLMTAHGDAAKKIWLTEYGAPTGTASDAVSTTAQADMISQAFAAAAKWAWAGPLFSYWQDAGNNLSDDYQNFGIINYDGTQKPAYRSFLDAARNQPAR